VVPTPSVQNASGAAEARVILDDDFTIDVSHTGDLGHTVRVRHAPSGRERSAARVAGGAVAATIAALRRALAGELLGELRVDVCCGEGPQTLRLVHTPSGRSRQATLGPGAKGHAVQAELARALWADVGAPAAAP
jgi:hypothetical protein